MRWLACILVFALFAGCAQVEETAVNNDLLPLAVGNEWVYARTKFVRGSEAERDTLRLRILSQTSDNQFSLERSSQYSIDTIEVKRIGSEQIVELPNAGLVDHTEDEAAAQLLVAAPQTPNYQKAFSIGADTTYSTHGAKRIHEYDELIDNDGAVALKLDFDHLFVPGIGQVAVRFVGDITQCLQCSITNEFWTYELVRYTVQ